MRIRILKPVSGVLDGVSLSSLSPGLHYDVEASLARYLISTGAAEGIASGPPALVIAADDPYIAHFTGGVTVRQDIKPTRDVAADKPARDRRKRR